jgi:20S proteasome alpha/beta subunit
MASPLLDNQFVGHNHLIKKLAENKQNAEDAAKDMINSIAERDIYTGDGVEICFVETTGVTYKKEAVRRD